MGALENITDRLLAFEEQTITGSKAFAGIMIQTGESLYWTNQIAVTSAAPRGIGYAQINVTAQLRLHRCKQTELQTNDGLHRQCIADLGTIIAALSRSNGRDLISTAYPTRYPAFLPQSEIPVSGVLALIPAPDGTDHYGAVITLTFAYIETGVS